MTIFSSPKGDNYLSHTLNWNSGRLTGGWQQGVNAFYYGLGFSDQDLDRAQVGIGTPLLMATRYHER